MQPASAANPLTQIEEPTASSSLADPLASAAEQQDLSPLASSDTPIPGVKPARPPKAAQRPSTGSVRHDVATADGLKMTGAEAGSAAHVAKVDDAAAGGELADGSLTAPTSTTEVRTSESTAVDTPQRSSTAEQSVSAQTGESSTSQSATVPASTSTTLPSTTCPTTVPAASSSAPAASASTPGPATTATRAPTQPSKKKRKGPFSFLLACIPCVSSTGHDDTPANAGAQPRPSTAARVDNQEKRNAADAAGSKDASTSSEEKVGAADLSEKAPVPATETAMPAPIEPTSAITPTATEPLVAAASGDTAAAQLAPPPTSAPSQRGVVLSQEETEGVTSGAVVPPGQAALPVPAGGAKSKRKRSGKHPAGGSATDGIITSVPEPGAVGGGILLAGHGADETSSEDASSDEDEEDEDDEEEEDEEAGLIARGGVGIPIGEDGLPHPLLEELPADLAGRKCLVLDLDETLVHSSFKMVHQADYVVPVEIENQFHNVYVIKRPGVDAFLKAMGEIYEVVVFTASLSKYADPVLDQLDVHRVVRHRLFRESCYNNKGNYVKDLSQLGRPISECIIIDNSPASYVFHPNNAVPISSWFNDPHDTELTDLVPFLADLGSVDDVRSVLDANLYPPPASDAGDAFQQL